MTGPDAALAPWRCFTQPLAPIRIGANIAGICRFPLDLKGGCQAARSPPSTVEPEKRTQIDSRLEQVNLIESNCFLFSFQAAVSYRNAHGVFSLQSVRLREIVLLDAEFLYHAIGKFRLHAKFAAHRLDDRQECADDQSRDILLFQA